MKGSAPDQQRWYRNTNTGEEVPGVSSILDMLPKPALTKWSARLAAEYSVSNMSKINEILAEKNGPHKAVDLIKNASSRYADKASREGTQVHHYTETIARAVQTNSKPKVKDMPQGIMPYLKSYVQFLQEFDVEPVMLENVVWNNEIGYAGRLDMACRLRSIDDALCIVDTKSGASGVWESVSLQQTAYRYAESYWDEEKDEFLPMPEVSRTYALWLRPEGFALIPVDSSLEELDQFSRLRKTLEWKLHKAPKVIRPAINKSPIKRQRRW